MTKVSYPLAKQFAQLMSERGVAAAVRRYRYVVWALDRPHGREARFSWYSPRAQTIRARVERRSVALFWPRTREREAVQPYPDALNLEFTFHASETALVLPWLADLCLRREAPSVPVPALEAAWRRIRAGTTYEWTPAGTEAQNARQAAEDQRRAWHAARTAP